MHLGTKAKVTVGVGLSVALLFLVLGIRAIRHQAAPPVIAQAQPAPPPPLAILAAAARPIKLGETITGAMIKGSSAAPGSFPQVATPVEAVGKVAIRDIPEGAMVPRDALEASAKLAIRVPVGMRAVAINTTAEIAVAGLVRPGDRVDVQVIYPGTDALNGGHAGSRSRAGTLLQSVEVLAVGESVLGQKPNGNGEAAAIQARTVTLALAPEQISTLSLAKNAGAITLTLRNPADASQVALADLVPPEPPAPPAAKAPPAPRPHPAPVAHAPARPAPAQPIELQVGTRHETIYSGSSVQ